MMKRNGGRQVTVDQDGDIRDLPGGVKEGISTQQPSRK